MDWEEEEWVADNDGDEIAGVIACPYCKEEIYEDAQRCPYCEQYISAEDSNRSSQPKWVLFTALMLVALFVYFALAPLLFELF